MKQAVRTYLLAGCLIANLGVVAFAQTDSSTTTSTNTAQTTTTKKGKHCWKRKCRLKKLFHKKSSTSQEPAATGTTK